MKRGIQFGFLFFALIFHSFQSFADDVVGKVVSVNGMVMARVDGAEKSELSKLRYLKAGDSIHKKDLINTASDGSVKILFHDQSIMDIGQSSLFKVEKYEPKSKPEERQVELLLGYGKVRAAINQKIGPMGKFRLRTRAATMGVRGTEFYVTSDIASSEGGNTDPEAKKQKPDVMKTQVVVTEGKVEVAKNTSSGAPAPAAKPQAVLPGQKLTTTLDLPKEKEASRAVASIEPVAPPKIEKVETVSVEEMKSVVTDMKMKDTTFVKAVVVEQEVKDGAKGSAIAGMGASSGAPISISGADTMAAIQDMVKNRPDVVIPKAGELGIPGSFHAEPSFNGNFNPGFNRPLAKLRVIFHR